MKAKIIIFSVCLITNLIFFYFGLKPCGLSWDNLYKIDGDAIDYINSTENLLKGDGYTFFKTNEDIEFPSNFEINPDYNLAVYYTFRTPGFTFFYFPLRLLFSKKISIVLFILIQLVMLSIAKVLLAKISFYLTQSKKLYLFSLILITITPIYSQYSNLILTDTLGFSFLVLSIYYFVISNKKINHWEWNLFFAGLYLTLAFFLRPFLALFFPLMLIYIIINNLQYYKSLIYAVVSFLTVFIVLESAWIIRNFILTDKVILTAATNDFQNHKHLSFFEIRKLSTQLALPNNWWDTSSPVNWYVYDQEKDLSSIFKRKLSTEQMNNILYSREMFKKSLSMDFNSNEKKEFEKKSAQLIKEINQELKESLKIWGYLKNRTKTFLNFINQSNIRYFHAKKYPINVLSVFMQSFLQKLIIYGGIFGGLVLLLINNNRKLQMLVISNFTLLFFFVFLHVNIEARYIYTLLAVFTISFFQLFKHNSKCFKLNFISLITIVAISSYQSYLLVLKEINW